MSATIIHPKTRKELYDEYLRSSRWQELSDQAKERDGYRCRLCFSCQDLEVHHRKYPDVFGEEPVDWLTTLCGKCHTKYHGDKYTKQQLRKQKKAKKSKQRLKKDMINIKKSQIQKQFDTKGELRSVQYILRKGK